MNPEIVADYAEKVYAWAVKRTYSDEEAADLSQEILFTALRQLPKLRQEERFEPWLWGIASNVIRTFRRRMGKQRAMFSYDTFEDVIDLLADEPDDTAEQEELYARLREKVAMLSAMYRDIIILHYYDGLSTKRIAEQLGIPEGTVTWRLSEARRKLKKECENMEQTALRPVKIRLDVYGNGNFGHGGVPFPTDFIEDALSQNILYYSYEQPRSIEELAKLCGVPAYYIEDRIDNLIKHEAMIEPVRGKYQTNFIIHSDKYGIYSEENAEKALLPLMDRLIDALKNIAREAANIDFYRAEKSETDLFYLYGVMAFKLAGIRYCRLPRPEIKPKKDGFGWCYLGSVETGKHPRISINTQHCGNGGSHECYTHTTYSGFGGIPRREMMLDLYINVCEDILRTGETKDVENAALAIKEGYIIRREDGSLFVTSPAMTWEQKEQFFAIADKYMAPLMDDYSAAVATYLEGYRLLFPKHLADDAARMSYGQFSGLYRTVIAYAIRTGAIPRPTKGVFCDILIQRRPTDTYLPL